MLARSPGIIRLMTWNIHGGVGPDRCFDLERIAALITRHRPDIVALQEIDTRGRGLDCLAPLHRLHSAHFAEVRTVAAPDGHYGHAVFSRWPTTKTELHDLSMHRREPRFAIETRVETPHGDLHLVAVHLGLDIIERRRQARMLAALATKATMPTVVLGDFNDWFSFGQVRKTLARVLPVRTRVKTFPAMRPMLRLDRVYCSDPAMLVDSFTDEDARRYSDHLPVIADIRLPEPVVPGNVDLSINENRRATP